MITAKEARKEMEKAKEDQFEKQMKECFDSIKYHAGIGRSTISMGDMGQFSDERVFNPTDSRWNRAKEILEEQGFKVEAIKTDLYNYTNISW